MFKTTALPALLLAALCLTPAVSEAKRPRKTPKPTPNTPTKNVPGQFDFYVLTLSWSPDYCAAKGAQDPQQCGSGRQLGFVLHGLWPQYNRGWPANCTNEALNQNIKQQFPDLYPSPKLYAHEWQKHGTCSGLSQQAFHQLAADLKAGARIPDRYNKPSQTFRTTTAELRQDFVKSNPGLSEKGIAPTCSGSGRFLQEVMICHTKNGKFGVCSPELLKNSQKSCGQPNFLVRSVR